MRALTVIKLGGSHAFAPHLRDWLAAIAGCAGSMVLVPGGGPFADLVRDAQARIGFDDDAAHRMALLAMAQYGCALASLNAQFTLAECKGGNHVRARGTPGAGLAALSYGPCRPRNSLVVGRDLRQPCGVARG